MVDRCKMHFNATKKGVGWFFILRQLLCQPLSASAVVFCGRKPIVIPLVKYFTKGKGPVKLIKRVKIAHLFLVFVRLVPRYYFKIVYVILQMAVKDFF